MRWIPFFLSIFLLTSCQKENSGDSTSVEQAKRWITGSWQWDYSVNPWTAQIFNPATEGYTLERTFDASGEIRTYRNGQLQSTGTWSIEMRHLDPINQLGEQHLYLIIDGKADLMEISATRLRINQTPYDGPDSYYVKKT
jgi:hypothetical protein